MSFDAYSVPMNTEIPDTDQKIPYSVECVFDFMLRVEKEYNLPFLTLFKKNKYRRVIRKYEDISLSEIRTAVITFLFQKTTVTQMQLAKGMRVDHSTIYKAEKEGRDRLEVKDDKFFRYYDRIKYISLL